MYDFVGFIADLGTTFASGLAIWVFIAKRKAIGAAIRLLLSYSAQLTMSELRTKLDRLVELNAAEPNDKDEIIAVMSDIAGQIRGNRTLRPKCNDLIHKLEGFGEQRDLLTEPRKRSIASELRETLRQQSVAQYDDLMGDGS